MQDASSKIYANNASLESKIGTLSTNVNNQITSLQKDIDERIENIETDINAKKYLKTTYINGSAWYRIWSDGWCEQGGEISTDNATITLLKPFASTNYTCLCVCSYSRINENFYINNKTTTTFHAQYASGGSWFACGYLAEGEY